MADDPHKKDYHDRDRINVNEPYELEYWHKKFNVTPDELRDTVRKVGPMVKDVEKELS